MTRRVKRCLRHGSERSGSGCSKGKERRLVGTARVPSGWVQSAPLSGPEVVKVVQLLT